VPVGLQWVGARVICHHEIFPSLAPEVNDAEWLLRAGHEGWVVLTKDKAIRYNPLERQAVLAAKVRCFMLMSGNADGYDMARALMIALPTMDRMVVEQAPPFIARVSALGKVTSILR
jgi:PIN like domain